MYELSPTIRWDSQIRSNTMALFEDRSKEIHTFPTHPAFVCPVEIKETKQYGEDDKGVFALATIPKGTKFWVWTERVQAIHHEKLEEYIDKCVRGTLHDVQKFLRQGFVLPQALPQGFELPDSSTGGGKADDYFYSNPTDAGRFINHSDDPNCDPDGALRDILPGEEITMDYSFHGDPKWYQNICAKYGVLTEAHVAKLAKENQ